MRTLARLTLAASLTTLGGCQSLLNSRYADSVPPTRGIERILPALVGRFSAQALRVPTLNVSAMDPTVQVRAAADVAAVNRALAEAAGARFDGVLGYTEEPLASCDFNHDPRSSIIDASQTRVSGSHLVKVLTWFDNEWGFANRMLDVAEHFLAVSTSSVQPAPVKD